MLNPAQSNVTPAELAAKRMALPGQDMSESKTVFAVRTVPHGGVAACAEVDIRAPRLPVNRMQMHKIRIAELAGLF